MRRFAAIILALSLTAFVPVRAQEDVPAPDDEAAEPADAPPPAEPPVPVPGMESEAETVAKCLADLKSPDAEVRYRAVLVLSKYENDGQALAAVGAALRDLDTKVRRSALVSTITRAVTPTEAETMLSMLGDADDSIRRLTSSHLPRLLMFQYRFDPRPEAGVRLPRGFEPILVKAFTDKDATVRKNVLSAVGSFRAVAAANVERIVGLLQDPDRDVRILALVACHNLLPPPEFVVKAKALVADPDRKLRLRLAQALTFSGAAGRQELLRALAKDEDFEVATEAAIGLLDNGDEQVWADLRKRLDHPRISADQASRVIDRLANMGAGARQALEGLLHHERAAYRAAALAVYGRVAGPNPDQALLLGLLQDPALVVRKAAADQLMRVRKPDAAELRQLAKSPHEDVRLLALALSNRLPNKEVGELLLDLLVDDQPTVRGATMAVMARRQLENWQDIVREGLGDAIPEIRRLAAEALIDSPADAAGKLLEDYLQNGTDAELKNYIREQLRMREVFTPLSRPAPRPR